MTDAKVRIVGEDATGAAWAQAISTAQGAANSMRSLFAGAFAGLGVGIVAESIAGALKLGEALKTAAASVGITGAAMSELSAVAARSGISMEELTAGLKRMETAVSKGATASAEQSLALEVLGVHAKDLVNLAPDKMFAVLAERIAELPNATDRSRAATDIFGRSLGSAVVAIYDAGGSIEAMRTKLRDLGQTLNDDTINKLADGEKSVKGLNESFHKLWVTLVSEVAPALGAVSDALTLAMSGNKIAQMQAQIESLLRRKADIEAEGNKGGIWGAMFGPGAYVGGEGATSGIEQQLDAARKQLAVLQGRQGAGLDAATGAPVAAGGAPGAAAGGGGGSAFAAAEAAMRQAAEDAAQFKADMKDIEKANDEFLAGLAKQGVEQTQVEKKALDEWLAAYEKRKTTEEELHDKIISMQKEAMTDAMQAIETFRKASTTALDDFLLHGQFTFKKLAAYMLESLAVSQLNKALAGIFQAIEDHLPKGGGSGGDGLWGSLFGAVIGAFAGGGAGAVGSATTPINASNPGVPGLQTGGSFDVGGSGGNDSQLVAFRATPGEHVQVGNSGDASGGGNLTFNPVYHIDARGADAERIMSIMPSLLSQTAEKAKRDVLEAFRRNNLPHPSRA
jgi:hypothetical protein